MCSVPHAGTLDDDHEVERGVTITAVTVRRRARAALLVAGFWIVLLVVSVGVAGIRPDRVVGIVGLGLPAGLWMALPVPDASFPAGDGVFVVCAAYWGVALGLHVLFVVSGSRTWLMASIAMLLVSLGGCMLGDMRHLFVWR